jgi:hypothetical protein
VIAPPPGELFSETNDNSVAILLSYGAGRVLLAGDAEAREEEYMAGGPYTRPLTVHQSLKLQNSQNQDFALSWPKEGLRCSFVPTPFDLLDEVLPWGLLRLGPHGRHNGPTAGASPHSLERPDGKTSHLSFHTA